MSSSQAAQLPAMVAAPPATPTAPEAAPTPAKSGSLQGLRSFIAGGVGGVCAVVIGHPFDLVKVRLQTAEKHVYSGAVDVVRKTVAREGLFRGYDVGQRLIRRYSVVEGDRLSVAQISAAGFFSAIPMTLITGPFERVKVLLQIQGQKPLAPGEKPKYAGSFDVVRQLYRTGGVRSVFRGSAMTLARDGPGSAAYFAAYELVKRRLTPPAEPGAAGPAPLSLPAVCAAGAAAGVAMWIPVFPIDTVKSRLQSSDAHRPSVRAVVVGLYRAGGFRAFFPGFAPAIARAIPANAATFVGVELAHKFMSRAWN